MNMAADAAAPVVREKSFDEFHLYTLQRPATLRDNETKQVEFVRATGIQSQRLYVYDGAQTDQYAYYSPEQIRNEPGYGTSSNKKIWVMQELKNSESNHLGIALPKGRLRFYRRDTDGSLQFIGENSIDHTPKDEMIRVYTGNAFDIVGERKRTFTASNPASIGWTKLSRSASATTRKKRRTYGSSSTFIAGRTGRSPNSRTSSRSATRR